MRAGGTRLAVLYGCGKAGAGRGRGRCGECGVGFGGAGVAGGAGGGGGGAGGEEPLFLPTPDFMASAADQ